MKFTDEQFQVLSQYEDRFHTAVYADWARNPGSIILRTIHEIWKKVTGVEEQMRFSCAHCILRLLKEVGTAYFADKAEREQLKAQEEAKNKTAQEKQNKSENEPKGEGGTTEGKQNKKATKGKKTSKGKK